MKRKSYSARLGGLCFALGMVPVALGGCGADADDPAATNSTTATSGGDACPFGQTRCGSACVDLDATAQHCGACGAACALGQTCEGGDCTSPASTTGDSGSTGPTTSTTTTGTVATAGDNSSASSGSSGATTNTTTTGSGGSGNASSDSGNASSGNGTGGSGSGGTTTTSSSSSSTTGGSECGVAPINPDATAQARNLLCYLYEVYGSGVLSGQQETSWNPNPNDDVNWYNTNFGVYPAVLGGDYLYPDGTTQRAIAYWNAGGITMIRYHMGAPPMSDTYENSMGTANIANVLQPGTSENDSFYSKLDYVADELQQLEDANVAVLWAPFHEFQPNGWFWWSKGTDAQFRELWQNMFDYLTDTKGLDNLVWLAPSSGSPNGSWYPDEAYYDVGGPDTYATDPPFASMYNQARGILGMNVPITLHETGTVVQPDSMFPNTAPWVLFNVWAGYYNDGQHNTTPAMQSAYASEYTITRDEVPNLK